MLFGCRAWIRTKIPASKGRCPTVRRPGNVVILFEFRLEVQLLHSLVVLSANSHE